MTTPRTCPVHGLPLASRRAQVVYGLVEHPEGYMEAWRSRFPHGGEPPLGGCFKPQTPVVVAIDVCARCEDECRAWWRSHAEGGR